MIMHNPLDNLMENYAGRAISAEAVLLDFPYQFSDVMEVEDLLKNWASRHKENCQVLLHNPFIVKIFMTSREIDTYNRNMHEKNLKARKVRR